MFSTKPSIGSEQGTAAAAAVPSALYFFKMLFQPGVARGGEQRLSCILDRGSCFDSLLNTPGVRRTTKANPGRAQLLFGVVHIIWAARKHPEPCNAHVCRHETPTSSMRDKPPKKRGGPAATCALTRAPCQRKACCCCVFDAAAGSYLVYMLAATNTAVQRGLRREGWDRTPYCRRQHHAS